MHIDGHTQLIGLLGWPVSHTRSPAMHNAAAAALGLNWAYVPLEVRPEELATAVAGLAALGFRGVNVTVPHKQAVIPLLDVVDPAARAIGAVNTITVSRGSGPNLQGTNTDWQGFLTDLKEHAIQVARRGCLILGAGGSARAVAYALAHAGGRVHLLARRQPQAAEVAYTLAPLFPDEHISYHHLNELPQIVFQWPAPLIINTTPLGMSPHSERSPWPAGLPFPADADIYDLVYNPAETRLMQQAAAAGCRPINGLGMLLHQGALAFELWTGENPDLRVMQAALENN